MKRLFGLALFGALALATASQARAQVALSIGNPYGGGLYVGSGYPYGYGAIAPYGTYSSGYYGALAPTTTVYSSGYTGVVPTYGITPAYGYSAVYPSYGVTTYSYGLAPYGYRVYGVRPGLFGRPRIARWW